MENSAQNPNPSPVVLQENPIYNKKKQIRLLILSILVFLTSLVINYIILQQREKEREQTVPSVAKSQPEQSNVVLKKEYQNPFDKNAQYVNPFSQYKNPFDSLK
jgi:hypothetical protein